MTRPPRELICISFSQLQDPQADISQVISDAYGPDGLGILAVSDVPGFPAARAKLLPLASKLAALPKEQLAALEDRESGFNFGWSHGKEMLEKGKPGEPGCDARGTPYSVVSLPICFVQHREAARNGIPAPVLNQGRLACAASGSAIARGGVHDAQCRLSRLKLCERPPISSSPPLDLAKGSFYANPCYDRPYSDPELMKRRARRFRPRKQWGRGGDCPFAPPSAAPASQFPRLAHSHRYPTFCRPNIWPREALTVRTAPFLSSARLAPSETALPI